MLRLPNDWNAVFIRSQVTNCNRYLFGLTVASLIVSKLLIIGKRKRYFVIDSYIFESLLCRIITLFFAQLRSLHSFPFVQRNVISNHSLHAKVSLSRYWVWFIIWSKVVFRVCSSQKVKVWRKRDMNLERKYDGVLFRWTSGPTICIRLDFSLMWSSEVEPRRMDWKKNWSFSYLNSAVRCYWAAPMVLRLWPQLPTRTHPASHDRTLPWWRSRRCLCWSRSSPVPRFCHSSRRNR